MLFNLKIALQKKHRTLYLAARELEMSETRLSRLIAERATPTEAERMKICASLAELGDSDDLFTSGK